MCQGVYIKRINRKRWTSVLIAKMYTGIKQRETKESITSTIDK